MKNRPIGILATLKVMALMPGPATGLATRAAPEAAILVSLRLRVPVRRRRLGGVARVLIQPRAQLRDQRLEFGDPLSLRSDQRLQLGIRRVT